MDKYTTTAEIIDAIYHLKRKNKSDLLSIKKSKYWMTLKQ